MRPIISLDGAASGKSVKTICDRKPAQHASLIPRNGKGFHAPCDELRCSGAILAINGESRGPTFHLPGHRSDGASATAFFFTQSSLVRVISINASGKQRS